MSAVLVLPTRLAGNRLRRILLSGMLLFGFGAAAAWAPMAEAQDASTGNQGGLSVDGVLRAMNLKAKEANSPDFVEKSRPSDGNMNYLPVGKTHPERTDKVMTPAEVAAMTNQLDATRMAQQKKAGVKPVPVPQKPPKKDTRPKQETSR